MHRCANAPLLVGEYTDAVGWSEKNGLVLSGHRGDHFFHSFLKDIAMTFNEPKTTETAATAMKAEQHHAKAAEHLESAAKAHKEVSKLLSAKDVAAAKAQVKLAQEHTDKAHEHAEAAKKAAVTP